MFHLSKQSILQILNACHNIREQNKCFMQQRAFSFTENITHKVPPRDKFEMQSGKPLEKLTLLYYGNRKIEYVVFHFYMIQIGH